MCAHDPRKKWFLAPASAHGQPGEQAHRILPPSLCAWILDFIAGVVVFAFCSLTGPTLVSLRGRPGTLSRLILSCGIGRCLFGVRRFMRQKSLSPLL
jgi:hypothetical protein